MMLPGKSAPEPVRTKSPLLLPQGATDGFMHEIHRKYVFRASEMIPCDDLNLDAPRTSCYFR